MNRKLFLLVLALIAVMPQFAKAQSVKFSQKGGFYADTFQLSLSIKDSDNPGNTIRYTLNGNTPDVTSALYTAPMTLSEDMYGNAEYYKIPVSGDMYYPETPVPQCILIRAAVFNPNGERISEVATNSYFVSSLGCDTHGLPVISVCSDSDSLYNETYGIMIHYSESGRAWERTSNFEFYEAGREGFNQQCGLRTGGGTTNGLQQKSLKLYARSDYGKKNFNYKFFDMLPQYKFKHLALRPFGAAWVGAGITDCLSSRICLSMGLDAETSRPVVLYLNGEYYGIYFLTEKIDERYLENHYGIDVDIDYVYMLRTYWGDTDYTAYEDHEDAMTPADFKNVYYKDFRNYFNSHDLSNPEYYEHVCGLIDIDNFIDYQIAEIFLGNQDWPANNLKSWMINEGKWRWAFNDGDGTLGNPDFDVFGNATYVGSDGWPSSTNSTLYFRKLLGNDEFRQKFLNRFEQLLDSHFNYAETGKILDALAAEVEAEVSAQIERFKHPESLSYWRARINDKREYLMNRQADMWNRLHDFMVNYCGMSLDGIIWNAEQLQQIEANGNYRIVSDITLDGWHQLPCFSGTLDGHGHCITIANSAMDANGYGGLFATTNGAVIKNLIVKGNIGNVTAFGGALAADATNTEFANCESSVIITATGHDAVTGGLVGRMDGGSVYNCISYASINAAKAGGLVGETSSDATVRNSYVSAQFNYNGVNSGTDFMGGLVGRNAGELENCYVKINGYNGTLLKQLAAQNTGTVESCYYGRSSSEIAPVGSGNLTNCVRYADSDCPYGYGAYGSRLYEADEQTLCTTLFSDALNAWQGFQTAVDYAKWTRPTTADVNSDLPILKLDYTDGFAEVNAVSSSEESGIRSLRYFNIENGLSKGFAEAQNTIVYYGRMKDSPANNVSLSWDAPVYFTEDAMLTFSDNGGGLKGYAGVTFGNADDTNPDWHLFASPLSGAPVGINYSGYVPGGPQGTPSQVGWLPDADAYFPNNTPYSKWDFLGYDSESFNWIDFKRNTGDHYDLQHNPLPYQNETTLQFGHGYLAAIGATTFMQSLGTLVNDDVKPEITYCSTLDADVLFGNPYLAYLDFDAFAADNTDKLVQASCLVYDPARKGYATYLQGASANPDYASSVIMPHQGFFAKVVNDSKSPSFSQTQTMLDAAPSASKEDVDYPLVNLTVTDGNGYNEYLTVEKGRPELGGALKFQGVHAGDCELSAVLDNKAYSVAFADAEHTTIPVQFKAYSDGNYTMKWNVQNGLFDFLKVFDIKTGVTVDCLTNAEYRFAAATADDASRFKLLFAFDGVEENETDLENFAFMMGGNLIVNGQGHFECYDVNGRLLKSVELRNGQNTVDMETLPQGLYVLRLTNASMNRIQKIVVL